jgi:hypothetical protein
MRSLIKRFVMHLYSKGVIDSWRVRKLFNKFNLWDA